MDCLIPQILPWKQAYLTYNLVAYAGEGRGSQAPISPPNAHIQISERHGHTTPTKCVTAGEVPFSL